MKLPVRFARFASQPTIAAGSVLLMSLVAATLPARADSFVKGTNTINDVTVAQSANWTTLLSIDTASSPHSHECLVVASADVRNPGGNGSTTDQTYLFTVTLDNNNPVTNGGSEKEIELRDDPNSNDPDRWPVSTNARFELSANAAHTIRLLGRKKGAGAPNVTIEDSILNVACVD